MRHTVEDGVEGDEPEQPKSHKFLKDLSNWLTVVSIALFVVYGILSIVYEIALDLTHVRWAFLGYLMCCAADAFSFWICRHGIDMSSRIGKCLLYLGFALQCITGLYCIVAPIVVLCTYRFIPEVSAPPKDHLKDESSAESEHEEQLYHTFEEHVFSDPCGTDSALKATDPMWQCGYVNSIKIASWWMMATVIPKPLFCYFLLQIFRVS